jgi:hypothetical protein
VIVEEYQSRESVFSLGFQDVPFVTDPRGITVDKVDFRVGFEEFDDLPQRPRLEQVIGVEPAIDVACSLIEPTAQGVCLSVIGLRDPRRELIRVRSKDFDGAVGRTPIDHDVLYVVVLLGLHTGKSGWEKPGLVERGCDHRYAHAGFIIVDSTPRHTSDRLLLPVTNLLSMTTQGTEERSLPLERYVFAGLTVLVTFVGQESGSGGGVSFWFGPQFRGIPVVYPAVVGLLGILFMFLGRPAVFPIIPRLKSLGLWAWVVGGWAALALAIAVAIVTGAPDLFADWRNFVLTILVILVIAPWLSEKEWKRQALGDLVIAYGVAGVFLLVRWLLGGGDVIFDQRVTVFYWPHLFVMTFAAVAGAMMVLATIGASPASSEASRGAMSRPWSARSSWVLGSSVVCTLVIMLSFRRSFWLAWAVGMFVVLVIAWNRRQLTSRNVMAVGVTVTIGFVALFVAMGTEAVLDRFESFLPSSSGDYSATNEDHVNDVVEAFRAISDEPILGVGIGRTYPTPSLAHWKVRSFEVHNAVVHAWLKFGIVGMIVFLGFHLQWIRSLLRPVQDLEFDAVRAGLAAYIISQFANTLVQTWVYGRVQMAIHMGVLLAVVLANVSTRDAKLGAAVSAHSDGAMLVGRVQ